MRFSSLEVKKTIIYALVSVTFFGFQPLLFADEMISGADLKKQVNSFLTAKGFMGDPAISEARMFPNCASDVKITPMFGGMKTLKLHCSDPGGFKIAIRTNAVRPSNSAGYLQNKHASEHIEQGDNNETAKFLVLSRSVQKGEILSEEDVLLKSAGGKTFSGYFTKESDVVGRKLKRALSVNQVLLSRHLEINWAIEKGQKILIQSNAGPVSVVSAGIARNSAQVGELLEAENQMSGTIVEGIVVSNKKIRILTK